MGSQYSNFKNFFNSQPYFVTNILNEFKKPIFQNVFFQNLDSLKLDADSVEFSDDTWYQRPEKFCYDHYGEQYIFFIILLTNNITSIFNFKPNNFPDGKIIAPKLKKISKFTSYIRW